MLTPYVDVAFADQYNTKMGRPAWTALSDPEKEAALSLATVAINVCRYTGGAVTGQENAFPRLSHNGVLPVEVQYACCEEAYTRACDEAAAKSYKRQRSGVTSESIGRLSKSYSEGFAGAGGGMYASLWSDTAAMFLLPWRLGVVSIR